MTDQCEVLPAKGASDKRRLAYSLAAGAASVAGAARQADGEIQYFVGQGINVGQGFRQTVDFNGDDYADITLKNYALAGGNYQGLTVPFSPGLVAGFKAGTLYYVRALTAGAMIDAAAMGPKFFGSMAYGAVNPNAQFNNATDAFIGFAFPIGPENLYYGWLRVDVNNQLGTLFIQDWAYEDVTGVGILAGDTGNAEIPGDFDDDQDVDGDDFLKWQRGLGGDYNASDFQDWKDGFGSHLVPAGVGVPEPVTLGLLAAGAGGLAWLRRSRGQRG